MCFGVVDDHTKSLLCGYPVFKHGFTRTISKYDGAWASNRGRLRERMSEREGERERDVTRKFM